MPVPPKSEAFSCDSVQPAVRGYLHRPASVSGQGIVLAHGAGSHAQASLLVAIADAFCTSGFTVLRCDLPYRQSRPYGPPGPGDAARDREGLKNAVGVLRKEVNGRLFLAGHSYGGRQATMLCAEHPGIVDGLLLLSYPLHPPRKPQQLRTQHLPGLLDPSLFVQGTRDPFGSRDEIEGALRLIPARTQLLKVEGAGHDLGFKGKMGGGELAKYVLETFLAFFP